MHLLNRMAHSVYSNISTVLQMYQPLRMDKQTSDHVEFAIKINKPTPIECYYFGVLIYNQTVVAIFRSRQNILVRPADIFVLMTFLTDREELLKRKAPCFFNMCIPGLSETQKQAVFFHTSNRLTKGIGLKLAIVTDQATSFFVDKFETVADNIFRQLNLELTIDKIKS